MCFERLRTYRFFHFPLCDPGGEDGHLAVFTSQIQIMSSVDAVANRPLPDNRHWHGCGIPVLWDSTGKVNVSSHSQKFEPATKIVEHNSRLLLLETRCNSIVWDSYLFHTSLVLHTVDILKSLRLHTLKHTSYPTLYRALSFALTVHLTFQSVICKTTHKLGWGGGGNTLYLSSSCPP